MGLTSASNCETLRASTWLFNYSKVVFTDYTQRHYIYTCFKSAIFCHRPYVTSKILTMVATKSMTFWDKHCIVWCNSMTFWRNILHPASGSKSSSSMKLTGNSHLLLASCFLLDWSTFDTNTTAQIVNGFLQNYTVL